VFLAGAALTTALGCQNFLRRGQSPDQLTTSFNNDMKKSKAGYIGESCRVFGAHYSKIEGIELAFGRADTGSNPKPGGQREHLIKELGTMDLEIDIPTLLAGKDTEMVLLKGLIPPGAKVGDRFDVEVGVMRSSDATSLENGMVSKTKMFPIEIMGRAPKKGNVTGYCSGRILVDSLFETRQDQANRLHGYILGGGVVMEEREIGFQLAKEEASTKTAIGIARAINSRFTYEDRTGRHGVASPKTDKFVGLVTPNEYRHNLGRFLDIASNIVHSETPNQLLERMDKLEKELMNPATSELAAFRLEAIGKNGIPILKRAMRHESLEVKFYASEALAYMGEADGIPHLKMVAEKEPAFRWAALTALSTIPGSDAARALLDLLHSNSVETRYGAFQALQNHSPNDPLVAGQVIGDFRLHRIPSSTPQPMVHFSRKQRNEIVIFGDHQTVAEEFTYVEPGLTVKGTKNGHVAITKHTTKGDQRMVVTNQVSDVVESLQRAGFSYGDILKIMRQAKNAGTINTRLVINSQPKLGRTYVPGQFADDSGGDNNKSDVSLAANNEYDSTDSETSDTSSSPTVLNKMKSWFTGKK
jgi:flagellar basal body P-ring protein FlgI